MTPKNTFPVLDALAREHVPEDVNLLPQIKARVEKENMSTMKRKMKLITTLLIVILTLVVVTSTVYAIYRKMNDTGLQSVQDAGLVKNVNITAQPTLLPTSTLPEATETTSPLGNTQTLEGVTLTLKWVYIDTGRLALGLAFDKLPSGLDLNAPALTFENASPLQSRGWSFHVEESTAEYISYQVIQSDGMNNKVNFGVDIPLVSLSGDQRTALAKFHFDLKDIPVSQGQAIPLQQTYSVKTNGVEIRLQSVRVSPAGAKLVVCYDLPSPQTSSWSINKATLRVGNSPEVNYQDNRNLSENPADHCASLGFQTGDAQGDSSLVFRVQELSAPATSQDPPAKVTGPWEFYVDLPQKDFAPGQAVLTSTKTPVVIGSQTLEGVTMRLDWVFADARRMAFGYTIFGLPQVADATSLSGSVVLKDANGNPVVGDGGGSPVKWLEGQPVALTGTWSTLFKDPLSQPEAQFSVDITLGGGASGDWNYQIAQFEFPPSATPFPPGVFPPALPDRLVGTFHFDFKTTVYPEQDLSPNQSVTVNGLEMRLEKVEMTPSYANITLCYQKPSPQDWGVGGSYSLPTLNFAGYEASIRSYGLIYDTDLGGNISKNPTATDSPQIQSGRCVVIDFLLGNSNQPGTATLTIPDLERSIPEGLPDAEVKAAQAKLKAQGIEMDYTTSSSSGGGGGGGPVFKVKPEGMTDQEAYQMFIEALGYTVPGPWVFTFDVNP
jgi:hypothetical protein